MADSNKPNGNNGENDPFEELFKKLSENGFTSGNAAGGFGPQAMGIDPEDLRRMGLNIDPNMISGIFASVSSMMNAQNSDEPVNWNLARQHARQALAAGGSDPSVTQNQKSAVADATQLADLWLDPVTSFERPGYQTEAWSKAEFIENSFAVFQEIAGPIAVSMSEAMNNSMEAQMPEEIKSMLGGGGNILSGIGGMMFGMMAGQAVAQLANEAVSSTDIGLPLAEGRSALLPAGVAAFGEGLEIPTQEVMLYLAVREAALVRLYKSTPWLRDDIIDLIKRYARGIHIDIERMQSAAEGLDPMNPEAMQEAFAADIFTPQNTEDQQLALQRLETLLALVEGWVTVVAEQATKNLPASAQLAETMNRRHASGGPAEHVFASLVGLELHPKLNREAAAFWRSYGEEHGTDARDELWKAPETLPTAEELTNLDSYAQRVEIFDASDDEFDAALEKLLSGGYDEPASDDSGDSEDSSEDDTKDDDR
ncbi:zinc-dependent metalloprotease [Rothia aerolata]|uniref:Hydrolase n=1 Tax=Rothia aerolata TaxID=1812262 RepID=A0A917IPQ5_9MICC|nr:zinc-dependent metalloprotease [Rothia aerolata]GGH59712.1 hydrolase [Rothia aerolata]